MSELLSMTNKNEISPEIDRCTDQTQDPMQAFLSWLSQAEVDPNLENLSRRSHLQIEKSKARFSNGPYVETIELMVKHLPWKNIPAAMLPTLPDNSLANESIRV